MLAFSNGPQKNMRVASCTHFRIEQIPKNYKEHYMSTMFSFDTIVGLIPRSNTLQEKASLPTRMSAHIISLDSDGFSAFLPGHECEHIICCRSFFAQFDTLQNTEVNLDCRNPWTDFKKCFSIGIIQLDRPNPSATQYSYSRMTLRVNGVF